MEDFEKIRSLVRDFNCFCDIVSMLRHNDKFKLSDSQIEALTDDMKKYCDNTYCRGEELANEVRDICPEVMDLKKYVSIWESQLNEINTAWMEDEETFNDGFWKARIGEYHTCQMYGLLYQMEENYIKVKDSVRNLINSYGLETEDTRAMKEFAEEKKKKILKEDKKDKPRYEPSFSNLIDPKHDKQKVLDRFHLLCDNQRPIDIGTTIAVAVNDGILTREPRTKEFESEFSGVKYGSVYKYFHLYNTPGDDNKEKHDQTIYDNIEGKHFFPL